jgi:nucleotide-binding universal stress UspA family protein
LENSTEERTVETIIVPLDRSAPAEAALPYAVTIAKARGATLKLVTVTQKESDYSFPQPIAGSSDVLTMERENADRYQHRIEAELGAFGLTVAGVVRAGDAVEEILQEARSPDSAMIAMSTHGRGGLERWVVGSVADKVMRLSPVPVLLVRPATEQPALVAADLRHLLVPLDGSDLAETAVSAAAELCQALGADLLLVRVEPFIATSVAYATEGLYTPDLTQIESDIEATAKDYLESVRAGIAAAAHCETQVLRGMVDLVLPGFIADRGIDLVVMSTHGRGGLTRLVLGSTADRLVRSGAPTLLFHPRES